MLCLSTTPQDYICLSKRFITEDKVNHKTLDELSEPRASADSTPPPAKSFVFLLVCY